MKKIKELLYLFFFTHEWSIFKLTETHSYEMRPRLNGTCSWNKITTRTPLGEWLDKQVAVVSFLTLVLILLLLIPAKIFGLVFFGPLHILYDLFTKKWEDF